MVISDHRRKEAVRPRSRARKIRAARLLFRYPYIGVYVHGKGPHGGKRAELLTGIKLDAGRIKTPRSDDGIDYG